MNTAHLLVYHYVPGTVEEVFAGFTQELFEVLAPAFPPSTLLRYDGNQPGDVVEILLGFQPVGFVWRSLIVSHEIGSEHSEFVDEGQQLPPPLTYWRHRHVVRQAGPNRVEIVEDITFGTPAAIITKLMKPIIKAQFEGRAAGYAQHFQANTPD